MEKRISQLKLELSKISEERWRAALSRNSATAHKARIRAAEKALENADAIAEYVGNFSTPMAKQIKTRDDEARKTFEVLKHGTDSDALQAWVKQQLIPSMKLAEKMGHMAASAVGKAHGNVDDFHKWSPK